MSICCCDWFNKEADWPIARQDKARQKRILGRRRRRVESEESRADAERNKMNLPCRKQALSHGKE